MGLTVIGGIDSTGVVYMMSQFTKPICGPSSFIGEIDDDETLHDSLDLYRGEAFEGNYCWWAKKGAGVVRLTFKVTDKEDVTVVIHSGATASPRSMLELGNSTVSGLQDKTMYLDRWRPGCYICLVQVVVHYCSGFLGQRKVTI